MTELELRNKVVNVMQGWLGWSEANGKYRAIIDLYNTQRPLPRGYAVQYNDEWCATTVTAAGMAAGLHDIIFGECSCTKMIELFKAKGRWEERADYVPDIGDIVMYYWKDGKDYATTDCTAAPNHVGIVERVAGTTITVIEGNKGETVARRTVAVNGRYIRGYCLPDYASMATIEEDNEEMLTYEQWKEYMNKYRKELRDNDSGDWSQKAREWAMSMGLFAGNGIQDNGEPNMMWEDFLTREQAAQLFYRFALDHGMA